MIREDAISSWARVILAVDWIDRIRCRMARSCAAMLCLPGLGLRRRRWRRRPLDHRLLVDVLFLRRLDLLLRFGGDEHLPAADLEAPPELLDRVLERGGGVVAQLAGLPDRRVHPVVAALQVVEELALEPPDLVDRHV